MELEGVFSAAGTRNFFREGWWFHKYYRLAFPGLFSFKGATFITKTATLDSRMGPRNGEEGNLSLNPRTLQPLEWFPKCIKLDFKRALGMNAVGLTGPGLDRLLRIERWQNMSERFVLSLMLVRKTLRARLSEARVIVGLLSDVLWQFKASLVLELNFSCANSQHNPRELEEEILPVSEIISVLGIPFYIKVNNLVRAETVLKVQASGLCQGISISNAVPFGEMAQEIDWVGLFGTAEKEKSPLAQFGGGALSGWPLVEPTCRKIRELREAGVTLPIKGGGGIGCRNDFAAIKKDIDQYIMAGATALDVGTVALVRPWFLQPTIRYARRVLNYMKVLDESEKERQQKRAEEEIKNGKRN